LHEPDFAGRLSGFTLLFEALILMLAQQMPFAAVARIVGESVHRVMAVCERYVELALAAADFSEVKALAIDETSRARGHDYITLAADAVERRVLFVTEGRDAKTIERLVADLDAHGCPPAQIESVSIDMSPALIKGCTEHLPDARITFDKLHVVWHANAAVDKMRRIEQRTDKSLKGMRWKLLKDRCRLNTRDSADLDALIARMSTVRRAWAYKEQLREILERKQVNVVRDMLGHWCTWRHAQQGRADEGRCPARAPPLGGHRGLGFTRLSTIKTVIFMIAGKLDFGALNPHAR